MFLNYLTIGYNVLEAIVSIAAGLVAGSVALVGFGIDSTIEVASAGAAQVRLRADMDLAKRETAERRTHRIIGVSFLLLAAYVLVEASHSLWLREQPDASPVGIIVLAASTIVMPVLGAAKRKVAFGLTSGALVSEAFQTSLCAYLSVIALAGVALNAAFGWWWADPVAAIAMVPIIAKEGMEGVSESSE
jgi:divalent metal cation (Fe/Co/Zn/Cd) transporter